MANLVERKFDDETHGRRADGAWCEVGRKIWVLKFVHIRSDEDHWHLEKLQAPCCLVDGAFTELDGAGPTGCPLKWRRNVFSNLAEPKVGARQLLRGWAASRATVAERTKADQNQSQTSRGG